jgi:hypothetical protein
VSNGCQTVTITLKSHKKGNKKEGENEDHCWLLVSNKLYFTFKHCIGNIIECQYILPRKKKYQIWVNKKKKD